MPGKAVKIIITERQQEVLQTIIKSPTASQQLIQRAKIILLAFEGWLNKKSAPRRGANGKFTAEQIAQLLAVACESPEKSGRPITHWTHVELVTVISRLEVCVLNVFPKSFVPLVIYFPIQNLLKIRSRISSV